MHLNESEVARFYSIWFPLLHFVNQHRNVVPAFPKEWRNAGVSPEVAVPVRDTLWEDDSLRETFIAENLLNCLRMTWRWSRVGNTGLKITSSSSAISRNIRSLSTEVLLQMLMVYRVSPARWKRSLDRICLYM
ncbi:hypothetical protein QPK87_12230 [Kamptonema cortianum]|nr:hypothetical protein [Kamptonema cortianum]